MSDGVLYVANDATGPLGAAAGYFFAQRTLAAMTFNPVVGAYPLSLDPSWPLRGVRQLAIHPESEVRAVRMVANPNDTPVDVVEGSVVRFGRLRTFTSIDRLDAHDGKLLLQWTQSSQPGALLKSSIETRSKLSIVLPAGFLLPAAQSLYAKMPRAAVAGRMNGLNYGANRELGRFLAVATQVAGVVVAQTTHAICGEHVPPYAPVATGQAARANFITFSMGVGAQTVLGAAAEGIPFADNADGIEMRFPAVNNGALTINYQITQ